MVTKDLSVDLCGLHLKNPVIPASGTFGFGLELSDAFDLNCLGGISLKGTTREARYGNPTPRIAECESGMINSVGLQNPGIDVLVNEKIPALRELYEGCIIANISGFSLDEYAECCAKADACEGIDLIEVNISCPNVHHGGMAFGTSCDSAAEVTREVKSVVSRKPVFIKLSPNVTDIVAIARACEAAGADGLTLVNTFLGMRIDIHRRQPVIANTMGGFSGRAIFPIALRMVYQVAHACRIPVMGCGGVASARDVIEMMMAGATAVQVGAENLRNPFACPEIINALPALMDELGINSLSEIIGAV
jgi:dihydroorotate dehydrogenase (NAD+) catalytic subunit